jgi:hypothetical protein
VTAPIDRPSPGVLVQDLERFGKLAEVVKREMSELPWFDKLAAGHQATKKFRLHFLLRSIEFRQRRLGPDERLNFERWIESDAGQELIADFAETAVRTSSRIAIAALGILYAHRDDGRFTPQFQRLACEALDGISDDLVTEFLDIMAFCDQLLASSEYPESKGQVETNLGRYSRALPYLHVWPSEDRVAKASNRSVEQLVVSTRALTNRGLILPIARTGGYGGDPILTVGISDDTRRFQALLAEAKELLA